MVLGVLHFLTSAYGKTVMVFPFLIVQPAKNWKWLTLAFLATVSLGYGLMMLGAEMNGREIKAANNGENHCGNYVLIWLVYFGYWLYACFAGSFTRLLSLYLKKRNMMRAARYGVVLGALLIVVFSADFVIEALGG